MSPCVLGRFIPQSSYKTEAGTDDALETAEEDSKSDQTGKV
jgi:hypothetical protein